ncbi:hypothetical protein ACHAW5_007181 [Stephanodiscus triporus]|uniref:Uncharacterized protein n=1 Tax=Stephanodiscus triporus TaxID=2934178 RepID=A0ABD3P475_9STRA
MIAYKKIFGQKDVRPPKLYPQLFGTKRQPTIRLTRIAVSLLGMYVIFVSLLGMYVIFASLDDQNYDYNKEGRGEKGGGGRL